MEAGAIPTIYVCYLQTDRLPSFPIMNYVVRAKKDAPGLLAENLRRELQSANGNQVVFYSRPMSDFIADTTGQRKFNLLLLGIFAFAALSLSAVGIYGLISYQVTDRRREMAIRTALGARSGDILQMVLWQGLKLALAGVAVGTLVALAVVRYLQSLLYGVGPTDVQTFLTAALILTGVAILACCVPARRATKVDPLVALRHE
jgi:ABC-type antimicrobial peptide transport system permease subunit